MSSLTLVCDRLTVTCYYFVTSCIGCFCGVLDVTYISLVIGPVLCKCHHKTSIADCKLHVYIYTENVED